MKKEYDFTNGERGKFFNPDAKYKIPVYLDDDVQSFYLDLARKKRVDFQDIVNTSAKANMQLFKTII